MIVVAPNYRLSAFGFLALPELQKEDPDGSTGNVALFDQRLAMKWAQQNIENFGGDPSRVAIFGESAGGFSVCFHLGSPGSAGLFHAAIMESGTCDGPQFFQTLSLATSFGQKFAESLGCKESGDKRLECLRSLSTHNVMKSVFAMLDPNWPDTVNSLDSQESNVNSSVKLSVRLRGSMAEKAVELGMHSKYGKRSNFDTESNSNDIDLEGVPVDEYLHAVFGIGSTKIGELMGKITSKIPLPALAPAMAWGPCVDGTDVALPDRPLNMFKKGQFNDVPTIFGTNKDEGSIFIPFIPIIKKGAGFPPDTHSLKEGIKK